MARKTGSLNHTHFYFKRDDGLWACAGLDGCTHFMPKNMSPAPIGYLSYCWGCKEKFILLPANMENNRPMCDKCMEEADRIDEHLNRTLKPLTGLAAFGARTKSIEEKSKTMEEVDSPESEFVHSKDCEILVTGICTCQL